MNKLISTRYLLLFFHLSIITHESFACGSFWECIIDCCFSTAQNNTAAINQVSTPTPRNVTIAFSAIPATENSLDFIHPSFPCAITRSSNISFAASSSLLMGVEIETSAIKLSNASVIFLIISKKDNSWLLETDTSDTTFQNTASKQYYRNLELKTRYGHTKKEIISIGEEMETVLTYLHENANVSDLELDKLDLKSISIIDDVIPLQGTKLHIKAKGNFLTIRPQVTYQLSLYLIPKVFERLKNLGHKKIPSFLECTDPFFNIPFKPKFTLEDAFQKMREIHNEENKNREEYEISYNECLEVDKEIEQLKARQKELKKKFMKKMRERNIIRDRCIKSIFYLKIYPLMELLEKDSNIRGFYYLFFYYWHMLFNDKENLSEDSEPGPKRQLAVLSRIPLSQIFDGLKEEEKEIVVNTISPMIKALPQDVFKLLRYNLFDGTLHTPTLTLQEWYYSIINSSHRKTVGVLYKKIEEIKQVDLLSPPPELEDKSYSMGLFDMTKNSAGFPLIEVRGYANLEENNEQTKIRDTKKFIAREANWFFDGMGEKK